MSRYGKEDHDLVLIWGNMIDDMQQQRFINNLSRLGELNQMIMSEHPVYREFVEENGLQKQDRGTTSQEDAYILFRKELKNDLDTRWRDSYFGSYQVMPYQDKFIRLV